MARKVSEGKSVKVKVPPSTVVDAGTFVKLGGFLGLALQSVTTGESEIKEVVLDITPGLYETSQIAAGTYNAGSKLYWDDTNKVFTNDDGDGENPFVGVVVVPKDTSGVIVFYFNPYTAML